MNNTNQEPEATTQQTPLDALQEIHDSNFMDDGRCLHYQRWGCEAKETGGVEDHTGNCPLAVLWGVVKDSERVKELLGEALIETEDGKAILRQRISSKNKKEIASIVTKSEETDEND